MIRVRRGQGVQDMVVECEVPCLIAEESVELYQGWSTPFIAPRVLPVLQADFLQLTPVQGIAEAPH